MSLITLGVADLQRAAAFYERVIGWMAESSPPGVVFFDLNGVVFALWPHDELAKDAGMIADSVHYSSWLVELSLIWGEKKVLEYVRKLLPLSAGQVRYGEIEERDAHLPPPSREEFVVHRVVRKVGFRK